MDPVPHLQAQLSKQVLDEHHRKISEQQLQRWREGAADRQPQPPAQQKPECYDKPPRVPLIDPYAPETAYPSSASTPVEVYPPLPPQTMQTGRHELPAPASAQRANPRAIREPEAPSRTAQKPRVEPQSGQERTAEHSSALTSAAPSQPKPQTSAPSISSANESWSAKQQRLKREQREARLAENLRQENHASTFTYVRKDKTSLA